MGEYDLGRHSHESEAAKRPLTREISARPRNRGATSAEDVHFPTRVHSCVEQVHVGGRGTDLSPAALECGRRSSERPIRALLLA